MEMNRRVNGIVRSILFLAIGLFVVPAAGRNDATARVYVVLWFDTEDYILPASDDAALHVADFLTKEQVKATFKVVGEKARTLERRGRKDVIAALKRHEIGYHSNFHSVEPTPAIYLAGMGWDEGIKEFDRRERPGLDDVARIFGCTPTCYGQPGSSWAPQSYAAMRRWKMGIYLDAGNHVNLDGRPCYYCGIFNLYKLTHTIRANLANPDLKEAEDRFLAARQDLLAQGGGVVSICYHPCEFVHKQFWDRVNFRAGANPPREKWKLPPVKTLAENQAAYSVFERYVRFLKHFSDVQFVTASEAAAFYSDEATGRRFTANELKDAAESIRGAIHYHTAKGGYALSPAEIFALLHDYVLACASGRQTSFVLPEKALDGPSEATLPLDGPIVTDRNQFYRTVRDVKDFMQAQGRVPSTTWLGSVGVPPEAYLRALAQVAVDLANGKPIAETIEIKPTALDAAKYVADDGPGLWRWVIFPPGFRAPRLMELAKRQAWTLKPAFLHDRIRQDQPARAVGARAQ
jgi:hypothetical protein